ncbi:MAG: ROK family protein [Cellulomonadaceae bacterium]|nr:ROK family protein [Cellulomonadaceae bacterium]
MTGEPQKVGHADAFQVIGLDLSDAGEFRGGLLDVNGTLLARAVEALDGATGPAAVAKVVQLCRRLVRDATAPLLGIGVGSPGVVDSHGSVETAPNLGWFDLPLQGVLIDHFEVPVIVVNDADAALLAEYSFGDTDDDMMLVKVGHGVGASLLLAGAPLAGSMNAAGEIGHVIAGDDGGPRCVCGKQGCLETWLAVPRLHARLAEVGVDPATAADSAAGRAVLAEAGRRLGLVLAPVIAALNVSDVVLSGPENLLDGTFVQATLDTVRARTLSTYTAELSLRMTVLGEDNVMRGAAVTVVSQELGFS